LDRAEPPEDVEHGVEASRERSRRREEVPGDEKAARGLGGGLHREDASNPVDALRMRGGVTAGAAVLS
jgi:hypothetical protein